MDKREMTEQQYKRKYDDMLKITKETISEITLAYQDRLAHRLMMEFEHDCLENHPAESENFDEIGL